MRNKNAQHSDDVVSKSDKNENTIMKNWISRRNVLSAVSAVTAAGILTACGGAASSSAASSAASQADSAASSRRLPPLLKAGAMSS